MTEEEFRKYCSKLEKQNLSKLNNFDLASSLFQASLNFDYKKINEISSIITDNEKNYLHEIIKSGFPVCYYTKEISNKLWFDVSKALKSKILEKENKEKEILLVKDFIKQKQKTNKKHLVIYSNDLRSHLGGYSFIPHLMKIKQYLDLKITLLINDRIKKTSFVIGLLKHDLFENIIAIKNLNRRGLEQFLEQIECECFMDATRNLLLSNIYYKPLSKNFKTIDIWGYGRGLSGDNSSIICTDKGTILKNEEIFFSEKIYTIPGMQILGLPKLSKQYKLQKSKFTVGIFSNPYKMKTNLLIKLFKLSKKENLNILFNNLSKKVKINLNKLAEENLAQEQIIFADSNSFDEYIELLDSVNLLVDIPYMGGGRSLGDSVSLGIPVLSLKGACLEERNGYSLLSQLKLGEFICSDINQFSHKLSEIVSKYQEHKKNFIEKTQFFDISNIENNFIHNFKTLFSA